LYAILGEFTGAFVFVVSQQFDDAFLVWGGSMPVSYYSMDHEKKAEDYGRMKCRAYV
jgi:hypothetical protein